MSNLYPIIEDIISAMNLKFGTDITAEKVLNAYTPEYDEDKKEFTKEDLKWLASIITSHSFSGGVRGLIKKMEGKFNNDLIQNILDASKKYGELRGIAKFISDYDNLKNKLPKTNPTQRKVPHKNPEVKEPVNRIEGYLNKVKEKFPKEYNGSFYEHTHKVLNLVKKVQTHKEPLSAHEQQALLSLFATSNEDTVEDGKEVNVKKPGLLAGWRRLNVKGITGEVKSLYDKLSAYSQSTTIPKKDIIERNSPEPTSPLGKEILEAAKRYTAKPVVPEEKDMEINKEMKGEKRDNIKEVVKEVPKEDKLDYSLGFIKDYLNKAKKSFEKEINTKHTSTNLHSYTVALMDALEKYHKGGKDKATNKKIQDIFNDNLLPVWDELNKPIAKRLREYKSALLNLANQKEVNPEKVDSDAVSKIDSLHGQAGRIPSMVKDIDKEIVKALSGKKEKEQRDEGVELDPTFLNKLIKELVKHRDEFPKTLTEKSLLTLDLPKEHIEDAKFVSLASKILRMVDKVLAEDENISNEDLAAKVLEKARAEAKEIKEKGKEDMKLVLDIPLKDREVPVVDEEALKKKKKSSINIISNYKETLFYKLERLANISTDKLVKAELEDIAQDIKGLF